MKKQILTYINDVHFQENLTERRKGHNLLLF